CTGMILHLVDHPLVKIETYEKILEAAYTSPDKIILPGCGSRRGHPTVFPARFFGEILTGPEDIGVRFLLDKYPEEVIVVNVGDPGIFTDVDTKEQYENLT
ncbi:MAG: NTP transferase domain-containing protein, partial [Candidatus Eremiobacteraeota bacterium]|nr:NTP transferase domain-containing protein [Candidatus Eremiobacteraeota bacterium]